MTDFTEGMALTPDLLRKVPVGSRIEVNGSTIYVREEDGYYSTGHPAPPHHIAGRTVTLHHVGTGDAAVTLERFKQRLRTLCMGQAHSSSVSREPVREALRLLNIEPPVLREGMWAHLYDEEMQELVPVGTVGLSGNPAEYAHHGIWVYTESGWRQVLGARNSVITAVRISQFPEGTALEPWPEPAEDEQEQMRTLIREAYRIGMEFKSAQGWCGDMETALGRAGVDELVIEELSPPPLGGRRVHEAATYALMDAAAPGTRISENGTHWVKCFDGTWWNIAATHFGYIPQSGGNQARHFSLSGDVRISWRPLVTEVDMRVESLDDLRIAPLGSRIANAGTPWTKTDEDQWSCSFGNVRSQDFNTGTHLKWLDPEDAPFTGTVGSVVASFREMDLAPVGSEFRDGMSPYVKGDDGQWMRRDRASASFAPHQFAIHSLRWTRVGPDTTETAEPAGITAGTTVMSEAQMLTAPIGYVVRATPTVEWRKEQTGWRGNNSNAIEETPSLWRRYPTSLTWGGTDAFDGVLGAQVPSNTSLATAPVGTLISREGNVWEKTRWDEWTMNGRAWASGVFAIENLTFTRIGA
jgi:hypothetical protein